MRMRFWNVRVFAIDNWIIIVVITAHYVPDCDTEEISPALAEQKKKPNLSFNLLQTTCSHNDLMYLAITDFKFQLLHTSSPYGPEK